MSLPIAECRSCRHSYADATNALRCRKTKGYAELPCHEFCREPGSDVAESPAHRVWYEADEQGRGD